VRQGRGDVTAEPAKRRKNINKVEGNLPPAPRPRKRVDTEKACSKIPIMSCPRCTTSTTQDFTGANSSRQQAGSVRPAYYPSSWQQQRAHGYNRSTGTRQMPLCGAGRGNVGNSHTERADNLGTATHTGRLCSTDGHRKQHPLCQILVFHRTHFHASSSPSDNEESSAWIHVG